MCQLCLRKKLQIHPWNATGTKYEQTQFVKAATRIVATFEFGERDNKANFSKLLEILNSEKIGRKENMEILRYDPPFYPPFLQRNEVAVEIEWNES